MILQQTMMQLSKPGNKKVSKLVMLSEYGLAIHKGEGVNGLINGYVISHFNSGKSVLKHIKERKNVDFYVQKLVDALPSWQFTLEEFDSSEWKIDKMRLKPIVDKLQKEILQGEKK